MSKGKGKGKGKVSRYDSDSQPEDSADEGSVALPPAKKARFTSDSTTLGELRNTQTASSSSHRHSSSPLAKSLKALQDAPSSSQRGEQSAKGKGTKERKGKGDGGMSQGLGALARLAAASSGRDSRKESDEGAPGSLHGLGAPDYVGGGPAALFSAKRMSDQFVTLRQRMDDLSQDVRSHDASFEDFKFQLQAAIGEMKSIDAALGKSIKKSCTMLDSLVNHEERLTSLEGRLEVALAAIQNGNVETKPPVAAEGSARRIKGEKERDNSLQDAVHKCLCCMMGIVFGGPLPQPCNEKTYWERVYDRDSQGNHTGSSATFLRPDWEQSWTVNQTGWSIRAVARIQQRGHEYVSTLTAEHLATLSRDTIVDAIRVVFVSMAKRWKLESGDDGEAIKKVRNEYAKTSNRKRFKAKSRASVCDRVPAANTPEFAYQLQWQYQSSDESELEHFTPMASEKVVDPDTNNEGESKLKELQTHTIWVSHAPAWRLETTNKTLDVLDAEVVLQRKKGKVGCGNAFRDRRRGCSHTPDTTVLPTLKRSTKGEPLRIPRMMINQEWLKSEFGVQYDSWGLISDDKSDNASRSGSGIEEGEDMVEGGDIAEGDEAADGRGGDVGPEMDDREAAGETLESGEGERKERSEDELEYA